MKNKTNMRTLRLTSLLCVLGISLVTSPLASFDGWKPSPPIDTATNKAHGYVDYVYGNSGNFLLRRAIEFIGEAARALALPVTNPHLLRVLHGVETVADGLDAVSSGGFAVTNNTERGAAEQPNLLSRFLFGGNAIRQLREAVKAAKLTSNASGLAAYKKSLSARGRAYLSKLRNKRLITIMWQLLVAFAASKITPRAVQAFRQQGGENPVGDDIASDHQGAYLMIRTVLWRLLGLERNDVDFEKHMLEQVERTNEYQRPKKNQKTDLQKKIDSVMSELGINTKK